MSKVDDLEIFQKNILRINEKTPYYIVDNNYYTYENTNYCDSFS